MSKNPLLVALVGLLLICAAGTVLLAARHFFAVVQLQKLQVEWATVNNTLSSAQNLANATILYSARNPAITSVLDRFKTTAGANATVAPLPALESSPLAPVTIKE